MEKDKIKIFEYCRHLAGNLYLCSAILFSCLTLGLAAQDQQNSVGAMVMESVWFSADRSLYAPGDDIHFSAIVLETDTYTPSCLSKILKIELIDSSGEAIIQKEFLVDNSRVNHKLSIPHSINGGWYYIKAYTNWMRNSYEAMNNLFPVKIINPDKTEALTGLSAETHYVATIYPENESLIGNYKNICALKFVSGGGDPIATAAFLLSVNNDTLARIETDNTGWGSFSFTPGVEGKPRIVVEGIENSAITTVVPGVVFDKTFGSFNVEGGDIKLTISNTNSNSLKLLIHRNYSLYNSIGAEIYNRSANFTIPASSLPGGIMQFTIMDENSNILFKRLFLNHNPMGNVPEISFEYPSGPSSPIIGKLRIEGASENNNQLISTLIAKKDPVDLYENYMAGVPGWPVSYDLPINRQALDGWLIANRYPDKVAKSLVDNSTLPNPELTDNTDIAVGEIDNYFDYIPETRGYTLTGRLTDQVDNPVKDIVITATLLSDNDLHTTTTFSSGIFHFTFPDRKGSDDIVVSFASRPHPDWKLSFESHFDTTRLSIPDRTFSVSLEEAAYLREIYITKQLQAIYKSDDNSQETEEDTAPDKKSFFGAADKTIVLDNYIMLPNIREVLYEVVTAVAVKKNDTHYSMTIIGDPPLPEIYSPLILIDGIPFYDFDEFLEFQPSRLSNIKLLKNLYVHGNALFSGIISFNSANNDLAGLNLPEKSHLLTVELPPYDLKERLTADEKSENPHLPGLQNTLFWKSFSNSVIQKFSFYINDNSGPFESRIFGFNAQGQWIYSKKTVTFEANALD